MSDLQVTQIDHVSVIITDVERSRRFYRDLLGLKEIAKPRTFDFVVLWFDLGNQHCTCCSRTSPTRSARATSPCAWPTSARPAVTSPNSGVPMQETTPIPGADRFFIPTRTATASRSSSGCSPTTRPSGAAELDHEAHEGHAGKRGASVPCWRNRGLVAPLACHGPSSGGLTHLGCCFCQAGGGVGRERAAVVPGQAERPARPSRTGR